MTPTEFESAFYTMQLQQPRDNTWYMDTGSTSHLTNDTGKFSNFVRLRKPLFILVGNGRQIPIFGLGNIHIPNSHPSLKLNNIYHVPQIIKNLVSIRKFTIDNWVFVTFDPFGFSMKELNTGKYIVRCNSFGELYPFTQSAPVKHQPMVFHTVLPTMWHNRLGHPNNQVLQILSSRFSIPSFKNNLFCDACSLGKHC